MRKERIGNLIQIDPISFPDSFFHGDSSESERVNKEGKKQREKERERKKERKKERERERERKCG